MKVKLVIYYYRVLCSDDFLVVVFKENFICIQRDMINISFKI